MSHPRWLVAASILGLLVAAASPIASAATDEDDGEEADTVSTEIRRLPSEGFEMTQERSDEESTHRVSGLFSLADGILALEQRTIPDAEEEDAPPTSLRTTVDVVGLFVFRDLNQNGRFDLTDEILDHQRLSDSHDPRLKFLGSGDSTDRVVATYPLQDDQVRLEFSFPDTNQTSADDRSPTPSLLLDTHVTHHGGPAPNGTLVAVETRILGPDVDVDDGPRITVTSDGLAATYELQKRSTAGNSSAELQTTALEQRTDAAAGADAEQALVIVPYRSGDGVHTAELTFGQAPTPGAHVLEAVRGETALYGTGLLLGVLLVVAGATHGLELWGRSA